MSKQRPSIRLICWNEDRAAELEAELEAAGFAVRTGFFDRSTLGELADKPPAALVIDLGRLPAQGRDVGVALRTRAGTRRIPLVFIDGAEEKIARTREVLPDAVYTTRAEMVEAVARAIAEPPTEPVVPSSNLAGYSGTSLPKKASGIVTDVTQNHIRSTGLATGLVDFKICAIDATWSGLCFTRRKK